MAASNLSCGMWDLSLRYTGFSLVVAHGLRWPAAYGILVPQNGIKPTPPAPEAGLPTTEQPGKPLFHFFCKYVTWDLYLGINIFIPFMFIRGKKDGLFFWFLFSSCPKITSKRLSFFSYPRKFKVPSYCDVSFPGWNGCDPDSVTSALPWTTVLSGLGQSLNSCPN